MSRKYIWKPNTTFEIEPPDRLGYRRLTSITERMFEEDGVTGTKIVRGRLGVYPSKEDAIVARSKVQDMHEALTERK